METFEDLTVNQLALIKYVGVRLLKNVRMQSDKPCRHAKERRHEFGIDGGDYYTYLFDRVLIIDHPKLDTYVPLCLYCSSNLLRQED